jgi:fused signal recognition particle receptor
MFGFLKEKLKSWLGNSKEKVETKVKLAEPKEKKEKKKEEEIKKPIKKEKIKKSKAQLQEERKITSQVIKDIKEEKLEFKTPEEKFEEKEEEIKKQKLEREVEELEKKEKQETEEKKGFFAKLKGFFTYKITESDFLELFEDLEMLLLENNVAFEVVDALKTQLKSELVGKEIKKGQVAEEIQKSLKTAIESILLEPQDPIKQIKEFKKENKNEPFKVLFFGINGAGKTTSIAKFCHILQKNKLSCILAAADTFRAASIEQLELHGNKLGVKVIKHTYGSDPSAVAFDAIKYAKTNNIDVVLIDTAGRMHTKDNLLKEMEKICRVTQPNMKIFVAEAIAGNDATEQAKAFNEIAGIDASILSKTDVDEKGGTILSIGYVTNKPILYLGIGQTYDDLELFNKSKFIERLGL